MHHRELGREHLHSQHFIRSCAHLFHFAAPHFGSPNNPGQWGRSACGWCCHEGNLWSFSTRRCQMSAPFPITPHPDLSIQHKGVKCWRKRTVTERGKQTNKPSKKNPRKNFERKPFLQPGCKHPLCSWLNLHHLIQILNASKCYYTFSFENKNDNNWNKTLNEKTQRLK